MKQVKEDCIVVTVSAHTVYYYYFYYTVKHKLPDPGNLVDMQFIYTKISDNIAEGMLNRCHKIICLYWLNILYWQRFKKDMSKCCYGNAIYH